ncbi:MAG: GNAT family N-acetyltransferase [Bacilli bacterium]|nr:GNAT family N-acetyltransferase [Bacilli bacterium]
MEELICRKATISDIFKMVDDDLMTGAYDNSFASSQINLIVDRIKENLAITYVGTLNDEIICEITAAISPIAILNEVNNTLGLVDNKTAYLFNILTKKEYRNHGYFTKLLQYVLDDLKSKGYDKVTLGVDVSNKKNMSIYKNNEFNEHIKSVKKIYGKNNIVEIEYLGRKI